MSKTRNLSLKSGCLASGLITTNKAPRTCSAGPKAPRTCSAGP